MTRLIWRISCASLTSCVKLTEWQLKKWETSIHNCLCYFWWNISHSEPRFSLFIRSNVCTRTCFTRWMIKIDIFGWFFKLCWPRRVRCGIFLEQRRERVKNHEQPQNRNIYFVPKWRKLLNILWFFLTRHISLERKKTLSDLSNEKKSCREDDSWQPSSVREGKRKLFKIFLMCSESSAVVYEYEVRVEWARYGVVRG